MSRKGREALRRGDSTSQGLLQLKLPTPASPVSSLLLYQVTYMFAVTLGQEGTPLVLTVEPPDLDA